jgi:hypothetical protein
MKILFASVTTAHTVEDFVRATLKGDVEKLTRCGGFCYCVDNAQGHISGMRGYKSQSFQARDIANGLQEVGKLALWYHVSPICTVWIVGK